MKNAWLQIRIDPGLKERVKEAAGRNMTAWVESALRAKLGDREPGPPIMEVMKEKPVRPKRGDYGSEVAYYAAMNAWGKL